MSKISILMPACNVERYIEECMNSVIAQTLDDIEIICIDDGSKDTTGEFLDNYAAVDSRIKVVHKINTGYGNSMNVALDMATGEYIGIVETDDFVDPEMFEKLYKIAKSNKADVVKANYYRYMSKPVPTNTFFEVLQQCPIYGKIFSPKKEMDIMRVAPSIWSGIYRRELLIQHNIRFNETPGASYQDTSFAFKVWTSAERVYLVKDAYLHYRVDNENSSVKSQAKVYCICDEYREIERYLEQYPNKKKIFEEMKNALKYESYRWNLQRLAPEFKYEFLVQIQKEFLLEKRNGCLNEKLFSKNNWKNLQRILENIELYYNEECYVSEGMTDIEIKLQEVERELANVKRELCDIKNSKSFKIGRSITELPRKIRNIIK